MTSDSQRTFLRAPSPGPSRRSEVISEANSSVQAVVDATSQRGPNTLGSPQPPSPDPSLSLVVNTASAAAASTHNSQGSSSSTGQQRGLAHSNSAEILIDLQLHSPHVSPQGVKRTRDEEDLVGGEGPSSKRGRPSVDEHDGLGEELKEMEASLQREREKERDSAAAREGQESGEVEVLGSRDAPLDLHLSRVSLVVGRPKGSAKGKGKKVVGSARKGDAHGASGRQTSDVEDDKEEEEDDDDDDDDDSDEVRSPHDDPSEAS